MQEKRDVLGVTLEKEFAFAVERVRLSAHRRLLVSFLTLGSGSSLILSLLLESRLGELASVEREIAAVDITDGDDISGTSEVGEESSGDGTINLELFHDD